MSAGAALHAQAKRNPFQQISALPASPRGASRFRGGTVEEPLGEAGGEEDSLDAWSLRESTSASLAVPYHHDQQEEEGAYLEEEEEEEEAAKDAEIEALKREIERQRQQRSLQPTMGRRPALPAPAAVTKERSGSFGEGGFTHRENPFDIMND